MSLVNEKLGEAWYQMNLTAEDCPPIRIPLLKCDLGKFTTHQYSLDNNSDKDVAVKVSGTNNQNFFVYPENIVIPPYKSTEI